MKGGTSLRGGTLFSGIGAPECAGPGIDWRWAAEIDPFASAVYGAHFPGVPNLGDVTTVDWRGVDDVDVLVFGSPCQSFSVAGRRRGMDDPRGHLALVALDVVDQLRPRWFIWENVAGVLSSRDGRDFAAFLGKMEGIGYSGAWRILDARFFGVPQRRRRLFLVGYSGGDWRPPAAVLFERESLRRRPAPGVQTRQAASRAVAHGPGAAGGPRMMAFGGNNMAGPIRVATAVNAHGGPHGRLDFESETFILQSPDPAPLLAFSAKDDGGDALSGLAPTLRAMPHNASHANAGGQVAVAGAFGIRRLSVRECERLMGLPEDWTLIPWRGRPAPDGRRHKAIGNSMAVPVIRWVQERLIRVDTLVCTEHHRL